MTVDFLFSNSLTSTQKAYKKMNYKAAIKPNAEVNLFYLC
jgi:hypothetical protein